MRFNNNYSLIQCLLDDALSFQGFLSVFSRKKVAHPSISVLKVLNRMVSRVLFTRQAFRFHSEVQAIISLANLQTFWHLRTDFCKEKFHNLSLYHLQTPESSNKRCTNMSLYPHFRRVHAFNFQYKIEEVPCLSYANIHGKHVK